VQAGVGAGEGQARHRRIGQVQVLGVGGVGARAVAHHAQGRQQALVPTLVAQKRLSTLGSPWLTEAALAEFLDRGYYDSHLGALHDALDARYRHCLDVLRELMPEPVRWTTPGGGPTLWVDFPRTVNIQALSRSLVARCRSQVSLASELIEWRHALLFFLRPCDSLLHVHLFDRSMLDSGDATI